MSKKIDIGEDCQRIMQNVREYVYKNRKFPSFKIISDLTGIPYNRCKERIEVLIGQNQLYPVFNGTKAVPTIVVPSEMISSIFDIQVKPKWIEEEGYRFKEASESLKKLKTLTEKLQGYELFERLLYATGTPLEEAVVYSLRFLDFSKVVHHIEDKDNADVTLEIGDKKLLLEVEGTSGSGNKDKVLQLNGWMVKEIDSGTSPENISGFVIVNHQRDIMPTKRGNPLTEKAVQYLKYHRFKLITTPFIYELIKQVNEGKISKEEAQKLIINGEHYEEDNDER